MIDFEQQQLDRNRDWQIVLEAYRAEQAAARQRDPERAGWVPRLTEIEGIDEADLPRIHGRLIAFGYLKFQLTGRNCGVAYQLSSQGRRALGGADGEPEDEDRETDCAEAA
jgi:hypothetical protein